MADQLSRIERRRGWAAVWRGLCAVAALVCLLPPVAADEPRPAERDDPQLAAFFEKQVRPVLVARCLECHGAEKQKAGLRLDSRDAAVTGGDSGPALVPGKPDDSLLVRALSYTGEIKMPPRSKLPAAEIAVLTEWIRRGAAWPNAVPVSPSSPTADGPLFTPEQQAFWAFAPVSDPSTPVVNDAAWVQNPIDQFILNALEAQGLHPAPAADRRVLIRRVTFDLTGLPPTPAEVEAFLADGRADAFARVVDRLLASPRYGERWARHWLDVARYGDTNGLDENLAFVNAYRYRDYVVAAFNRDKPYDQFVREQIAGDLLPESGGDEGRFERLIATGFLALGPKMLAEDDPVKMQMDIIDEQVDTVGRAFMGLTLGCARCHDHKFDPVPTEDYYSLAGIFKSTKTMENHSVVAVWQERPIATEAELAAHRAQQQQINERKKATSDLVERTQAGLLTAASRNAGRYLLAAEERRVRDRLLAHARPMGDDPQAKERPGLILVEAEAFVRGNVLRESNGYGAGIGVILNKGELPNFAEYDLDIPAAGLYQVELRYAAAGARPVKLSLNGELVKPDAASKATGTWFPDTQTWFVEGFYKVRAGKNTIRLECAGPFPHIDKLLLAPARLPDGQPPVRTPTAPDASANPDPSASTVPATEPAVAEALLPPFIQQWADYLDRTQSDPKSPLAAWHKLAAGTPPAAPESAPPSPSNPLEQNNPPATLEQLAVRYQQRFDQAQQAWQALTATDAGKSATALPDPEQESLRQLLIDPKGPFAVPRELETWFSPETAAVLKQQRDEVQALEQALPVIPQAMAVADATAEDLRVHLRGNHLTLGKQVPRQFLRIIAGEQQTPLDDAHSGRRALAEWLTTPDHPLTSRVMVNRLWQGHFGEGLVRSPDNFGRLGERPTHPLLLDWLARRFVDSGWSIKAMHRLILLSATYQQSVAYNAQAALVDPENRLCWRMNRRRLEIEALRDALLFAGGNLEEKPGGSLLPHKPRQYVTSTANVAPAVYASPRRSIYLPVVRSALYEVFQAFDFADPTVLNGKRDSTTVAPQALFMMNSGLMLAQTRALADRLLADAELDDAQRVRHTYELAYSRPPTSDETTRALAYVERYAQALAARGETDAGEQRRRAWQSLCRAVLSANEFVFLE